MKAGVSLLSRLACVPAFAAMLACGTAARGQSAVAVTPRGGDRIVAVSTIASLPGKPVPQPQAANGGYEPITARERLEWLLDTTLGPAHLAGGVVSAAYGTAVNKPWEDGPHWGGFAERYGVRLTGIATSNVMEGSIGAIWGEDPRYVRQPAKPFGARVANVLMQTIETRKRSGEFSPAYARYIAFTASNFLSNAWRPDSEADSYHAGLRVAEAFGGQLASNTWEEFWPSVRDGIFHRRSSK